jgi:hypothetical protein
MILRMTEASLKLRWHQIQNRPTEVPASETVDHPVEAWIATAHSNSDVADELTKHRVDAAGDDNCSGHIRSP